ncbi:MAG TPA: TRAM domain-containing protein, partial [Longimicrobiaceae bacterium]|nr:TRAM domain-containing protein [Longimicrobiaceae bacterium]
AGPPWQRREGPPRGGQQSAAPGESRPAPRPGLAARLAEVDEVEVTVEKLVAGGDCLARFEGIPLFIPRAAPGDRLRVRLVERRPDYGRAEIVEILSPGPGRRQAPCPYFTRCGGCDLQHLEDELQTRLKAEATLETLARLGGIAPPESLEVLTGAYWDYRLRTQLHTRRTGETVGEGGAGRQGRGPGLEVGYFERGSHELVPVAACPILVPELETLLPSLPARLAERAPRRLDLAAGDDGVSTAPVIEGLPHGEVSVALGDFTYAYDARCFFQAHRELTARLAERAVGDWEGGEAFDLFAGVGLFSLPLARRYRLVVAVEGDAIAARYARRNARTNGLDNVEVEHQAVQTWIDHLPEDADRVLIDPPRGGLPRKVRDLLHERAPKRLTYVSCHAATLARDLRALTDRYHLEALTLLDMFPQSGHMEVIAQLALKPPAG